MKKPTQRRTVSRKAAFPRIKVPIPFEFVLEEIAALSPWTRYMFGSTAVYVDEKIVLILRHKETGREDNGIWLATIPEHHESLSREFPSMRSISVFGPGPSGWQLLPEDADDFEESALLACKLILKRDSRIGKTPTPRKSRVKKGSKQ
jgi:hypothetical protein